jgi:Zn-finger nucleic acid-binding protein
MVYRELRWLCPRDGVRLEHEQVGRTTFLRCAQCRGVMVSTDDLLVMIAEMGGVVPATQAVTGGHPLSCPMCGKELAKARLGHVEADSCTEHGIWFDRSELGALLESIGLEALRRR